MSTEHKSRVSRGAEEALMMLPPGPRLELQRALHRLDRVIVENGVLARQLRDLKERERWRKSS